MQVILAQPRGFCAGVKRAIKIVSRAIEVYGAPLYVRHEIVHNRTVVEELKAKGAIFVDDISQVPDGATLIFSAHGVPRSVSDEAHARPLRIFDATCPLVTKVHRQVVKLHNNGKKIIMIGHAGHPEVEGTMGQIDEGIYLVESVDGVNALELESTSDDLSYVTQTTISVDDAAEVISALKAKFPSITEPKKNDVCYATQNRQDAVKRLADACDLVLVVGSVTSSNSNRLREVAERHGCTAKLIDTAADMHGTLIRKLSGGEKRRLYLLKLLMSQPNVLLLDEPTNDLDIGTLTVLEDYLDNFNGTVITVSHDRYFLDKVADSLYIFEGNAKIKHYVGMFTDYLKNAENEAVKTKKQVSATKIEKTDSAEDKVKKKTKLTYAEKMEYEKLESEIDKLENDKTSLEEEMQHVDGADYTKLASLQQQIDELDEDIMEKVQRWDELSQYVD